MGVRGPTPKRDSQRRRMNQPVGGPADRARGATHVEVPVVDDAWHPVAKRWYESLAESGQSAFYEPSDWGAAFLLAEAISRELSPQPMVVGQGEHAHVELVDLPPKGASLAAWLKGMTALMVTEGDRRRMRLELERGGGGETNDVAWIDNYRQSRESG